MIFAFQVESNACKSIRNNPSYRSFKRAAIMYNTDRIW